MEGEPKRKVAQAECFECHEIWPKNVMTQTFAVTSTRSSVSMRGSMSASTTKSQVWRCPNCQARIDEKVEKVTTAMGNFIGHVVLPFGLVLGVMYAVKSLFPQLSSTWIAHISAILLRHHI